jgi:hypothetical protein
MIEMIQIPPSHYSIELIKTLTPLAWPIILFFILLMLRKQIRSLLEQSTRFC